MASNLNASPVSLNLHTLFSPGSLLWCLSIRLGILALCSIPTGISLPKCPENSPSPGNNKCKIYGIKTSWRKLPGGPWLRLHAKKKKRLHAFTAGTQVQSQVRELRSHMTSCTNESFKNHCGACGICICMFTHPLHCNDFYSYLSPLHICECPKSRTMNCWPLYFQPSAQCLACSRRSINKIGQQQEDRFREGFFWV